MEIKNKNQEKPNKGFIIVLVILLIFGIWWFVSPSKEKDQKEIPKKGVQEVLQSIEKENDSISKIPKSIIVAEEYAKLKDKEFSTTLNLNSFELLFERVKGTNYEKRVQKTIDSLRICEIKNKELESIKIRKDYETELRNNFLDNNLDIKVSVYGKNNTKIKLTYALFNDVWFRKFETEGHFDKLNQKGFKRIELTDGYDYGKYITYK